MLLLAKDTLLAETRQGEGEAGFLLHHRPPIRIHPTICRGFLLTVCVIWGGTGLKASSWRTRSHSIQRFHAICHGRKAISFTQLPTNHDNDQPGKTSPVVGQHLWYLGINAQLSKGFKDPQWEGFVVGYCKPIQHPMMIDLMGSRGGSSSGTFLDQCSA